MNGCGRKVARFTSFSIAPKGFTEIILLFMSLKVCCLITSLTYQCKTNNDEDLFALSLCFGIGQTLESVTGLWAWRKEGTLFILLSF